MATDQDGVPGCHAVPPHGGILLTGINILFPVTVVGFESYILSKWVECSTTVLLDFVSSSLLLQENKRHHDIQHNDI